jgi:hypothetical protein
MPVTYEPIQSYTLGTAAADITLSSIAASWTDLRLVFTCPATASSAGVRVRFNSDSGTNYSFTQLFGDGSTAYSARSTSVSYLYLIDTNTSQPVFGSMDVFSYAGSTFKTALLERSMDRNGAGTVGRNVGLWRSTSAITSIYIYNDSAINFPIGTTATLYGIKNA